MRANSTATRSRTLLLPTVPTLRPHFVCIPQHKARANTTFVGFLSDKPAILGDTIKGTPRGVHVERLYLDNSLLINKVKGKGKAIPLQAWTGPEGSRRMRLPDFKTVGT